MENTTNKLQKQDGFKSQWGFIMAAVGSCVGMANVWRFPMLVSKYGGMTFLIWYFIFAFIICQSGMMEEFSLGRWAHSGPSGAFAKAMENGGKSKKVVRCSVRCVWRSAIRSSWAGYLLTLRWQSPAN